MPMPVIKSAKKKLRKDRKRTAHNLAMKNALKAFIKAAKPDTAIPLYNKLIKQLELDLGKAIQTGEFGADMQISLVNDGPVTIFIDTKNKT